MVDWIRGSVYVSVDEGAQDKDDRVNFSDVSQEAIAKSFALSGTLNKSRNIHKLHAGRNNGFGLTHDCQALQPIIRNLRNANVWVNCGKGIWGG